MLRSLLLAALPFVAAGGCNESCAVNYDATDADAATCHGPPQHLVFVFPVPAEAVAGSLLDPAPVVELRDAAQRRVLADGGSVLVTARYRVVAYHPVTGAAYDMTRSWRVKAEAGRANFSGAVRPTAAGAYNITFVVTGTSAAVDDLLASEVMIWPAAPAALRLMRQPGGGKACAPLESQPRLLLKDGYNNTVTLFDGQTVLASAVLGVDSPYEPAADSTLVGESSQTLAAGGAVFGSLGINSTGRAWRLVFSLDSGGGGGGGIHFAVTSESFDCHGAPTALRRLPGWPPSLEVVDAGGVRATAVGTAVALHSYLELPDGGLRQHGHLYGSYREDDLDPGTLRSIANSHSTHRQLTPT